MTAAGWPLRTARTLIRSARADDLPALYAIATRPEVARMLFLFRPGMDADDFAARFPLDTATPPFRAMIEQDDAVVGSIGVGIAGPGEPAAPIWYFLDPVVAGGGLGSEVVAGFATWLDGAGIGPLGAGVGVNSSGQVTGNVGVGASVPLGGSAARASVGVGTGAVLYDPRNTTINNSNGNGYQGHAPVSQPGVVVPRTAGPDRSSRY